MHSFLTLWRITVQCAPDRSYDQTVKSDDSSTLVAELLGSYDGTAEISNALTAFHQGSAMLDGLTIVSTLGDTVSVQISAPTLDGIAPVDVDISLLVTCPAGTSEVEIARGNVICNPCKSGEYERKGSCVPCVDGMVCDEMGVFLRQVALKIGYWRTDEDSDDIHVCRFGGFSCPGDGKNQAAGPNRYCALNYLGPLCSACAPTFFASWARDGKCYECSSTNYLPTIGLVSGALVLCGMIAACVSKKCQKCQSRKADAPPSALSVEAEKLYFLAEVKLTTLFFTAQVRW